MSFSNPSSSSPSTSTSIPISLTDELEQLTTAIQQVGDEIQTCKQASEERHVAKLARDDEETQRTLTVQEQLAQMLAMTQESLRRNKEEPLAVPGGQEKYARDLQRAAFGVGGDSESVSRSSMMESRESDGLPYSSSSVVFSGVGIGSVAVELTGSRSSYLCVSIGPQRRETTDGALYQQRPAPHRGGKI
ncbi:hypothetical protein C8T65DRAFT_692813 [Cerioporus squamosus]|nr:hypothetical protein C8T65DRAFT_692813 [Cerioporus squamosus]